MKKIILLFIFLLLNYCLAAQNQQPVAVDDILTLIEVDKLIDQVILNDSDPENDSIFTTLLTEPENGTLEYFCANGSFCYQPDSSFVGIDTFTYVLTDSLGNMDTAIVFLNVAAQDSIAFGAKSGGCTSTILPNCRTAFNAPRDPCTIPLRPSKLNRAVEGISELQDGFLEWKNLLAANDSCDFFALYDPPDFGTLYLANVNSSNVAIDTIDGDFDLDSLFYYEPNPLFIGVTNDSFGLLKCGELDDGEIYCDSIEIQMTIIYEEPCDYTDIEKYCCVSTTSAFPCDVLANDLALLDSIFPAPDYTVSGLVISDILMSPDSGMVNINASMDSLIYNADGFSGLDSLIYQTEFTVTNNITGETITFMSSPQTVLILPDDNCILEVQQMVTQSVICGGELCIEPTAILEVTSEVFALCPDDLECTNDLLSDYTYTLPPNGQLNEEGKFIIPIPENCPPEVMIIVCETENPDECVEVVIPLVYPDKVPTLSEWGLIILSLLMLIIGVVAIKTEQQAAFELSS